MAVAAPVPTRCMLVTVALISLASCWDAFTRILDLLLCILDLVLAGCRHSSRLHTVVTVTCHVRVVHAQVLYLDVVYPTRLPVDARLRFHSDIALPIMCRID